MFGEVTVVGIASYQFDIVVDAGLGDQSVGQLEHAAPAREGLLSLPLHATNSRP